MALDVIEINHTQITVPRAAEEASRHFYKEVLGLEEIPKPGYSPSRGGAWYRRGPVEIHLSVEDDVSDNHRSRRHVCYIVSDLAAARQQLRDAGIEIIPDQRPVAGWLRFYVRDPGGNQVEIAQRDSEK
ncbi:MAG TPA: VOC family protein [Blastocatellia bacterium]|nr:VOC family protein [Blastocatellia bacterium]